MRRPKPAPLDFAGTNEPRRKLTYKDQRDLDLLPARIEELEAAIARDEAALSDHDLYARDPRLFEALTDAVDAARPSATRPSIAGWSWPRRPRRSPARESLDAVRAWPQQRRAGPRRR